MTGERGWLTGLSRWLGAAAAGVVLIAAVACAGDGGESRPEGFEATPAFLQTVAENSLDEPFRFEAWISFDADMDDVIDAEAELGEPVIAGEQHDGRVATHTNLTAICSLLLDALDETPPDDSPLAELPDDVDIAFESIELADEERLYLRLPFLEAISDDELEPQDREIKELVADTDGWMVVDFSQVTEFTAGDFTDAMSAGQSQDPSAVMDMAMAANAASEIGTRQIRGEPTTGIGAETTLGDLLHAEGVDPAEYRELITEMPPGLAEVMREDEREQMAKELEVAAVAFDVMTEMTISMEVWIDTEAYVRRLSYSIDLGDFFEEAVERAVETVDALDEDDIAGIQDGMEQTEMLTLNVVVDLFDYGDPTIDVQPPDDAADVTHRLDLLGSNRLAQLSAEADRLAAELDRLAADAEALTEFAPVPPETPLDAYIPPDDVPYEPPPLPPVPDYEPIEIPDWEPIEPYEIEPYEPPDIPEIPSELMEPPPPLPPPPP